MAKLSGVYVIEFAIGMGPAIIKKQGKQTLYSLRAFPIGGYCRLEGEDEETDSKTAFVNQKLYKRFLVLAAGATLNVILGFLIFFGISFSQDTITTTTIDSLEQRAYIADSGILPGDEIIFVNGEKITFFNDISYALKDVAGDKEINVTVKRNGEKLDFSFLPTKEKEKVIYDENGATIISLINGAEEESYVAYDENKKELYSEMIGKTQEGERFIIGMFPKRVKPDIISASKEAFYYTGYVIRLVYGALGDMIKGKIGIQEFSGPVGVATAVDTAVHTKGYGLVSVLSLVAMLTINLGVFNLLPLPALDGGRIFFLLVELITRRPVPPEKEGFVHMIGMMLLLAFGVVVLFSDIMKLF